MFSGKKSEYVTLREAPTITAMLKNNSTGKNEDMEVFIGEDRTQSGNSLNGNHNNSNGIRSAHDHNICNTNNQKNDNKNNNGTKD